MSRRRHPRAPGAEQASFAVGDDELALVVAAKSGDERAFATLTERHSPRLQRILVRITGNPEDAHDALQDALLRIWQNIERFEGRSSFFTWMTRIGINEAHRAAQRSDHMTLRLDDAVGERIPSWGSQPDEVFASREFLTAVAAALNQLPADHRVAVVLRDVEGMSSAEAASALQIEEGALKSGLHRGRMDLRRRLDEYLATPPRWESDDHACREPRLAGW